MLIHFFKQAVFQDVFDFEKAMAFIFQNMKLYSSQKIFPVFPAGKNDALHIPGEGKQHAQASVSRAAGISRDAGDCFPSPGGLESFGWALCVPGSESLHQTELSSHSTHYYPLICGFRNQMIDNGIV